MEKQDKWIWDVQAGELVNLRDLKAVYVHKDYEAGDDYNANHSLYFDYYEKGDSDFYLYYDSSELLQNAFEHYKKLLGCQELDVSQKPLML